ncbi:MAG: ABC transporter permease [Myxococcales bacterium]|nr:ABC transporter permease [Myxococcales bacterium]
MIKRALRRLGWSVFVVWATVTLAFFVNHSLPDDPARMVAGAQARPQDVERIRAQLGLDRPILVQYGSYLSRLVHTRWRGGGADAHATCGALGPLHVDLGKSYQKRQPVVTVLAERAPKTALLAFAAVALQVAFGMIAGVVAASRKRTWADTAAVGASLVGVSAPTFVTGVVLQYVLAHKLRLLPLDGYGTTLAEHLRCLVLPALTLGVFGAAYYTRLVRDEMLGQLDQDYVRTAYAKGLSRASVLVRHALRNALMPLMTAAALDLGTLLGGAIVTESIFRWPGLGALSIQALLDRDGPVIMGCVILTSTAVVLANVVVDLAYGALDPRVRDEGAADPT